MEYRIRDQCVGSVQPHIPHPLLTSPPPPGQEILQESGFTRSSFWSDPCDPPAEERDSCEGPLKEAENKVLVRCVKTF